MLPFPQLYLFLTVANFRPPACRWAGPAPCREDTGGDASNGPARASSNPFSDKSQPVTMISMLTPRAPPNPFGSVLPTSANLPRDRSITAC